MNDGTLDLFFSAAVGQPILHGLRIERLTTGIGERMKNEEGRTGISVYPNPFNGEAVCRYQIDEPGWATLRVYDLLGREVATLVDGEQVPGVHAASFASRALSSGLYILALHTASQTVVTTAMLLR